MHLSLGIIEEIKAEAISLGFCLFGAIYPDPSKYFPMYKKWIESNSYGEMKYLVDPLSMQKRAQPNLIMEACQSVFSLGFPYPEFEIIKDYSQNNTGLIANYATLPDYHLFLSELIAKLIQKVSCILGRSFTYKVCIDSAPVMERSFGIQAGLGWIGKNSCLISESKGSSFFLCEILTDLELDKIGFTRHDRCGNCTRCIDACPTKCINPDRTLIANRCISYLTIEHRSIIPSDLREKIGNHVFGCDICQQVCPWNQTNHRSLDRIHQIYPSPIISNSVNLNEEIFLSDMEFFEKYGLTPISRVKSKGFRRNIAVALGNQNEKSNLSTLIKAIQLENDPLVRCHLYWALGKMNDSETKQLFSKFNRNEVDPVCKTEIAQVLNNYGLKN